MISLQQAARSVSKYLYSRNPQIPLFMYGSDNRLLLGYGNAKEFCVRGSQSDTNTTELLNRFLEDNCKSFVFGYVSFDYHCPDNLNHHTLLKFVVPTLTIEITPEGIQQVNGEDTEEIIQLLDKNLLGKHRQNIDEFHPVDTTEYDSTPVKPFIKKIEIVKSLINAGNISRLTLARKIYLPSSISLIDSFLSRKSLGIENERSYFWQDENIQFVGNNPELLAIGNKHSFETFKLSGTSPCSTEVEYDAHLKNIFVNDEKIKDEHENSIKSMAESLNKIGDVNQHPKSVIDWYNTTNRL
jgi:isochorismate synthase EntC